MPFERDEELSAFGELRTGTRRMNASTRGAAGLARYFARAWKRQKNVYGRRRLYQWRQSVSIALVGASLTVLACGELPTQIAVKSAAVPGPATPRFDCQVNEALRSPVATPGFALSSSHSLTPNSARADGYCTEDVITPFGDFDVDWGGFNYGADAADWGNDYGDGAGFIAWDGEYSSGEDYLALVAEADAQCPLCRAIELAEEIAEDPAVEEEAAAEAEATAGWAMRWVNGWKNIGAALQGQWHHIATDKNWVAGSQWSVQFKNIFDRFGMSLSTSENTVYVIGHFGPHPEEYHQFVFDFLNQATSRSDLESRLYDLGQQAATPGTYLNSLLTVRQNAQ